MLRMMSRAERDKRKADERTDKERQRDENRFLREKAREAARWAALHPQDDLEVPCPSCKRPLHSLFAYAHPSKLKKHQSP